MYRFHMHAEPSQENEYLPKVAKLKCIYTKIKRGDCGKITKCVGEAVKDDKSYLTSSVSTEFSWL